MAEPTSARGTARDRLARILYLLPAASREDGVSLGALAASLGVTRGVLLADIEEVTAREYYHRAGGGDDLRIFLGPDRVRVATTGEFRRPPKLDAREMLALGLGLRVLAAEPGRGRAEADASVEGRGESDEEGEARPSPVSTRSTRAALLDLARRLEGGLASVSEIEFAPRLALEETLAGAGAPGSDADIPPYRAPDYPTGGAVRGALAGAARNRRRCRLRYLKPDADFPEDRELEPYVVVAATGRWYAIGRDRDRDDIRAFRLDRILAVEVFPEGFDPAPDFDLDAYLSGGRVYRAPSTADPADPGDPPLETADTVPVRYDPSIARWILERAGGTPEDDGSAIVEHEVADPSWLVRHVLRYGGEAELLGPADLRRRVAEGARSAAVAHGG